MDRCRINEMNMICTHCYTILTPPENKSKIRGVRKKNWAKQSFEYKSEPTYLQIFEKTNKIYKTTTTTTAKLYYNES